MPPFIGNIVDGAVDLFKSYFPPDMSEAEKAKLKNDMTMLMVNANMQMEAELTKRLQADMGSDSWLSKNIRPMIMVYLLGIFSAFATASAYFQIDTVYVGMLKDMLMLSFGFYFGGRTIEKITSILAPKK